MPVCPGVLGDCVVVCAVGVMDREDLPHQLFCQGTVDLNRNDGRGGRIRAADVYFG